MHFRKHFSQSQVSTWISAIEKEFSTAISHSRTTMLSVESCTSYWAECFRNAQPLEVLNVTTWRGSRPQIEKQLCPLVSYCSVTHPCAAALSILGVCIEQSSNIFKRYDVWLLFIHADAPHHDCEILFKFSSDSAASSFGILCGTNWKLPHEPVYWYYEQSTTTNHAPAKAR